jgi:hypothetical protein
MNEIPGRNPAGFFQPGLAGGSGHGRGVKAGKNLAGGDAIP